MTIQWRAIDSSQMRQYQGDGTFAVYGVQNNAVVTVVPLFDWRDRNMDGGVSVTEWALMKLPIVSNLKTGMFASILLRIRESDPNVRAAHDAGLQGAEKLRQMGYEMAKEAIKEAYVKPLVAAAGGFWGLRSTAGPITQYIVKKGMEKAVLAAVELAAPH